MAGWPEARPLRQAGMPAVTGSFWFGKMRLYGNTACITGGMNLLAGNSEKP